MLALIFMPTNPAQQRNRPRKQPQQSRSKHTFDAIIEASARILERQGFEALNTNAVAELAGVSIGTLYQYFTDKEALLSALISRETGVFLRDVQLASELSCAQSALDELIAAAVRQQVRRPQLARLLDFAEAQFPLDLETQSVRERFSGYLSNVLVRFNPSASARVPECAADLSAIIRGLLDAAGERGEHDMEGLTMRVRRAVFGYLQAP